MSAGPTQTQPLKPLWESPLQYRQENPFSTCNLILFFFFYRNWKDFGEREGNWEKKTFNDISWSIYIYLKTFTHLCLTINWVWTWYTRGACETNSISIKYLIHFIFYIAHVPLFNCTYFVSDSKNTFSIFTSKIVLCDFYIRQHSLN